MTTDTFQVSDSIVRKIQLLLNLAANPGTEEEGAAAMARAQEILAKYNLDIATVQDTVVAGGTAAREAETKRDYSVVDRTAAFRWQQNLVKAIAEANYCRYWVIDVKVERTIPPSKRKWHEEGEGVVKATRVAKRHKVLGRLVNTTAVLVMADYLLATIERLCPYQGKQRLSRQNQSWCEGCADRLIERIEAKAEAMRTPDYATQGEAGYTTAIMVRDMAASEQAANYDHINGAGAWARKLARDAKWEAEWEAGRAAREAEAEATRAALAAQRALETPEQLAKREAEERKQREKEQRANDRWWRGYNARQEREAARIDRSAYAEGNRKGNDIGLDAQLTNTERKGLGR